VRLAAASDHAGLALRAEVVKAARELGHDVDDLGPPGSESVDYPDFACRVAELVASREVEAGVLVCGTGIGMSIAANKVPGVRAALCHSEFEARMARAHNDANVLCLGERVVGAGLAASIVRAFLGQAFEGGRHERRVAKLRELDSQR
jgi:ribose 5-phosphate isomerase B